MIIKDALLYDSLCTIIKDGVVVAVPNTRDGKNSGYYVSPVDKTGICLRSRHPENHVFHRPTENAETTELISTSSPCEENCPRIKIIRTLFKNIVDKASLVEVAPDK